MDVNELYITARLAKLALNEDEAVKLSEQVSKMLEYFSSMSEIDTSNLEPTNYVLQKENRVREDSVESCALASDIVSPSDLIANAPKNDGGFITIPNVL